MPCGERHCVCVSPSRQPMSLLSHYHYCVIITLPSDTVNLCQRVEYLSRATMCAKSVVGGGGELLHELEEKMEVARLQQQIHEALPAGQVEARARLNNDLLDITVVNTSSKLWTYFLTVVFLL